MFGKMADIRMDYWRKINELSSRRQEFRGESKKDYILMGLGNRWRGDDGAGCLVAQNFKSEDWLVIDCGRAPENFISIVRERKPKYLIVVDAAQMHLQPGEFRVIPPEKIDQFHITTHTIPLSCLISYLKKWAGEIILIGIQPKNRGHFNQISKELEESTEKIIQILRKKSFHSLKKLT